MEGFLFILNKKKYTRFWCVLEGQQLSQYAHLDLQKQEAVDIKGVLHIKNSTARKCEHQGKPHSLSLLCEGKKAPIYFDCGKAKNQDEWHAALVKGAKSHEVANRRALTMIEHASTLGIPPDTELTPRIVSRAYRRLCLKAHPDKGGDEETFNRIRHAYAKLNAYVVEEDLKANAPEVEFEAVIHKTKGVGLGIVVVEDLMWGRVVVQAVQSSISLRGISEEAEGEIRAGDSLYAIERDVCVGWPMSRVKARLNNFRVPIDSDVRLTFARRLPPQESDDVMSPLSSPSPSKVFSREGSTYFEDKSNAQSREQDKNPEMSTEYSSGVNNESDSAGGIDSQQPQDNPTVEVEESTMTPQLFHLATPLDTRGPQDSPQQKEHVTQQADRQDSTQPTFLQHLNSAEEQGVTVQTDQVEHEGDNDEVAVEGPTKEGKSEDDEKGLEHEVEEDDREDYERQAPVDLAQHREMVFKGAFDDNLRDLQEARSALKESQEREQRLKAENERLVDALSESQSQVRILQQDARKNTADTKKTLADLEELQERCDALTIMLEDKIVEMKMDGFTDASATRLQRLAKRAGDSTRYKRDLTMAFNQLASLKLVIQSMGSGDRFDQRNESVGSSDSYAHSFTTSGDSSHLLFHGVEVAQATDQMATSLKKQLLAVLDT